MGEYDERDARESSLQPRRRLMGGKVTGRRDTGRKETGRWETGRKETRRKEMGGKTNGSKERGVGETVAKESGGKETIAKVGAYLDMPQAGKEATSTAKPITECPKNMSEAGYRCVCLIARSIVNKKRIKHYGRRN